MAAWLIAAIERLPLRARRVVVAATALLPLVGAIASLTLQAGRGREAGRSSVTVRAPARRPATQPAAPRLRPPVSGSDLRLASRVAGRFVRSYLKFAYGRAGAESVKAVAPGLRGQLIRERRRVAPVEWDRHPRVVSLRVLGTTPGFVVATATVDHGGLATYRLRFSRQESAGRWLVRNVQDGCVAMVVVTRRRGVRVLVLVASAVPLVLAGGAALLTVVLGGTCSGSGGVGDAPSAAATRDIPGAVLRIYQQVGSQYKIPWEILAGIGKEGCDQGRDPDPSCTPQPGARGPGVANFAGASGPMQIGIGGAAGDEYDALRHDLGREYSDRARVIAKP